MRRRSTLALATAKPRKVRVEPPARDDFGELPARKSTALRIAHLRHGHQMGPWKVRANSTCGISDCYCVDCNRILSVALEPLEGGQQVVWGNAFHDDCDNVTLSLKGQ